MKIIKFLPFILIILYQGFIKNSNSLSENTKQIVLISFLVLSILTLVYTIRNKSNDKLNKTSLVLLSLGISVTIVLYIYSLKP